MKTKFSTPLSLLSVFAAAVSVCSGSEWTVVNPTPTKCSLYTVTYTGANIVATGDLGSVLLSPDGEHWAKVRITDPAGDLIELSHAVWSGKTMIVGGNAPGIVWSSPDGARWSRVEIGAPVELRRIIWTGSRFAGLGVDVSGWRFSPVFLSSGDGSRWSVDPVRAGGSRECF